MRVVIAPDKFAGTLSAVEAADAIASGWARRDRDAELRRIPMSDGGPGFIDVLHAARGGELSVLTVPGPYGEVVPATLLRIGETAYIESAQAAGLALTPESARRPESATSQGVGVLVRVAIAAGVSRVVVGLGGTGTNDGGAGLLAALGAQAVGGSLTAGPSGLAEIERVDLPGSLPVELVIASDVDNPLAGLLGATKNYGPQKGIPEERLVVVDGWLQHLAELTDRRVAAAKGAGAAGGIGFALMLLGATRSSGVSLVAEAVGLGPALRGADLVVTGEGAFDFSSRSGKVPYGVAQIAAETGVPCIALAGRVDVGAREMRALGVEAAYSMLERYGEEHAMSRPAATLSDLAERVARSWTL